MMTSFSNVPNGYRTASSGPQPRFGIQLSKYNYNAVFGLISTTLVKQPQFDLFCNLLGTATNNIAPTPRASLTILKTFLVDEANTTQKLLTMGQTIDLYKTLTELLIPNNRVPQLATALAFPLDNPEKMAAAINKLTKGTISGPQLARFAQDPDITLLKLMIYAKAQRVEGRLIEETQRMLGYRPELSRLLALFVQMEPPLQPARPGSK